MADKKPTKKDLFPMHEGAPDEAPKEVSTKDKESVAKRSSTPRKRSPKTKKSDPAPRSVTYTRGPGGSLIPS